MSLDIELSIQHAPFDCRQERLVEAVRRILLDHGVDIGNVSIAVVDDQTIHELNRRHLQHDYATDALSFLFDRSGRWLEGEIIISADTAAQAASQYRWEAADELLLYAVHAALHLVGYDDGEQDDRRAMCEAEDRYLRHFELQRRGDESAQQPDSDHSPSGDQLR